MCVYVCVSVCCVWVCVLNNYVFILCMWCLLSYYAWWFEVATWHAIIKMAKQGDPQAQAMCADIEAHGKLADRAEGGVHHRKASTMSGFVKARAEFPEETKPNKKDNNFSKVVDGSKVMSPQTKETLCHALNAWQVAELCDIATFLNGHDEAHDLQFLAYKGKGFPKIHWSAALLKKQHEVHHIACVSKNCILIF